MRVLQINSVCGTGSTGRIATDIHDILISHGHESYIAYGRGDARNIDQKFTIKIGNKIDNYLHVALTRLFDKQGFGSKHATQKLVEEIKKISPDIIHLHNIHGYYINIEILFDFFKESNIPVVWTLHDCWAFTGHCAHFDYVQCFKWEQECFDCPQRKGYPSSLFFDSSKRNFQVKKRAFQGCRDLTIVTPSDWLAAMVSKSFLKKYHVKVINNGINLNIFHSVNSSFRQEMQLENKFIILGVANVWGGRKGLEYFIKLSKMLNNDEVIVLVGLNRKQTQNITNNIISISRTNNLEELSIIYSAVDVFVNLTVEEVMGVTNVESLACGTPVITFDAGGSPECIDEKTGFVVEKENLKDLLSKIRMIKKLGKGSYYNACVNRAHNMYDKEIKFGEYLDLYKSKVGVL